MCVNNCCDDYKEDETGSDSTWHWFTVQLLHFIWMIFLIIVIYIPLPQLAQYSISFMVYFIPIGVFVVFPAIYFLVWKPDCDCDPCLYAFSVISWIGFAIFLGVYFGIFFPFISMKFEPATSCQIVYSQQINIDYMETYVFQATKFIDKDGNSQFGIGCRSDKKFGSLNAVLYPYKYLVRGDKYSCQASQATNIPTNSSYNYTGQRILKVGGSGGSSGGSSSGGSSSGGSSSSSSKSSSSSSSSGSSDTDSTPACYSYYDLSEVKMPSWLCEDYNSQQSSLYPKCYYNIYGNQYSAQQTSNNQTNPREAKAFYQVIYQDPQYYGSQSQINILVIFCLLPILVFGIQPCLLRPAFKLEPYIKNFIRKQLGIKPPQKNTVEQPEQIQETDQMKNENYVQIQNLDIIQYQNINLVQNQDIVQIQSPPQDQYGNPPQAVDTTGLASVEHRQDFIINQKQI